MMKYEFIIVLLGLFFLISCGSRKKEQSQAIDSMRTLSIDSVQLRKLSSVNDSLYALLDRSPQDLSSIFGTPKSVTGERYINVYNNDIDSVISVEYDSLSISLYYASAQKRFLLIDAEFRNNAFIHLYGFHVGDSDSMVIHSIGLPYKSAIDSTGVKAIIYEFGEVAESYIHFHFKDSKLIDILYQPYLD